MKELFFLIATLVLSGCMKTGTMTLDKMSPCKKSVPKEVTEWLTAGDSFHYAFGDAAPYDVNAKEGKRESIVTNTHPEITYLGNGRMRSRKYGWTLNVKYDPDILYENSNCIAIQTVPGLEHLFTWVGETDYIVDKRTGKVLWRYQTSQRKGNVIRIYAVVDDVFYFRMAHGIYCVDLNGLFRRKWGRNE